MFHVKMFQKILKVLLMKMWLKLRIIFVPAPVEVKVSDVFSVLLEEEDISDVVVSTGVVGLVLSSLTPLVESFFLE